MSSRQFSITVVNETWSEIPSIRTSMMNVEIHSRNFLLKNTKHSIWRMSRGTPVTLFENGDGDVAEKSLRAGCITAN
jgi:hypothetical protein